jgi:hypothetical protein
MVVNINNKKKGGVEKVANDWNWSRTVVIYVLFSFNLATILVGAAKCLPHLSFLIVFYGLQHHYFSRPT